MNEQTFLSALLDDPTDETSWHVLADWLDEDGQGQRAELLRLACRLRSSPVEGREAAVDRAAELLAAGVRLPVVAMTNSLGMRFCLVPAGRFLMGSPRDEKKRKPNEHQHEVEITRPFWLGAFQVTQRQYQAPMGSNPSNFCGEGGGSSYVEGLSTDDHPVEQVLFDDTQAFLRKLDTVAAWRDGWEYRLPSEAEWEYACRGGGL